MKRLLIPTDQKSVTLVDGDRKLDLTNLPKLFWKDLGITKGDLLQYYADVSSWLLPHIAGRPMVMKRYPNGAEGDFFYMKRAPSPRPEWIETCDIMHNAGNVNFPIINDLFSLLWVINLGCIDLNPWYALCTDYDRPDFLHFDLDPGPGSDFETVRATAFHLKDVLDRLSMPSYPKTTGSNGIHVYVPIKHGPLQKEVWTFAKAIALQLQELHPDVITAEYRKVKRPHGRVLVDYNQNAWGSTLASIYSVRPKPRATVSAPVTWEELEAGATIDDFTMQNMPARLEKVGDLWAPVVGKDRFDLLTIFTPPVKKTRAKKTTEGATAKAGRVPSSPPPTFDLPIAIPYPVMEAEREEAIPAGENWRYEPKWDGFRCVAFRDGENVYLQSKSNQPLARYFPDIVESILKLPQPQFVLDGEIVIVRDGRLSFDDMLLRLHPAASRVKKLAAEAPAQFFAFDLLVETSSGKAKDLTAEAFDARRSRLEKFFAKVNSDSSIRLSLSTDDIEVGRDWFESFRPLGLDGIMAKKADSPYRSGTRDGMLKIKHFATADCVVGGFRYQSGTKQIGALLLGFYDGDVLNHVGHASAFTTAEKKELKVLLEPLAGGAGFSGSAPGGPSRWSTKSTEWVPIDPDLVCEVRFDYFTQGRFRHGTKFQRWRPDKDPHQCTIDQVEPDVSGARTRDTLPLVEK